MGEGLYHAVYIPVFLPLTLRFPSGSSFSLTVAKGVPYLTCWRPEALWVLSLGIFAYIQ